MISPLTDFLNADWEGDYEVTILPALQSMLLALGSANASDLVGIPATEGRTPLASRNRRQEAHPRDAGRAGRYAAAWAQAITKLHRLADRADGLEGPIYRAAATILDKLPRLPSATLQRLRHCEFRECQRPWFWDATDGKTKRFCSDACRVTNHRRTR